jgi:hypothetical protein
MTCVAVIMVMIVARATTPRSAIVHGAQHP